MTIELIAIIALAGLMIGLFRWLKQDMLQQNSHIIDHLDKLDERMVALESRMNNFEQRLSRLEATLETLFRLRAIPPIDPSPGNTPGEENKAA